MADLTIAAARLHVRLDVEDGPVVASSVFPDARVKVVYLEYERALGSDDEDLWAYGRPTTGRRGVGGRTGLDETLGQITADQRAAWLVEVRAAIEAAGWWPNPTGKEPL